MVQARREANAMRLFMSWILPMALVPDILPQSGENGARSSAIRMTQRCGRGAGFSAATGDERLADWGRFAFQPFYRQLPRLREMACGSS